MEKQNIHTFSKEKVQEINNNQIKGAINKNCPYCHSGPLHERVPRSWIVKNLLFFLPLKRYKCYRCGKKPYIL